jgi:lipid-A-disaccharide synthase
MLETARLLQKELPGLRFVMSQAPHVTSAAYENTIRSFPEIRLERYSDRIYDLVHAADFALVASGTATLETALLGTPFFLLYKASASTFFLGRRLVRIPYIGLVNVLAGRHVVPEFIQHLAQPVRIAHDTKLMLEDRELREKLQEEVGKACAKLGRPGASVRAAEVVSQFLNKD